MTNPASLQIRDSRDDDLNAIQKIYAHHVRHGTGSFEIDPPDLVEIMRRRGDVLRNGFPYLVACRHEDEHERVIGFAYVNFFRLRPAYRFTAENSIYIDPDVQRSGVGRKLLGELLNRCEALGLRQVVAMIGDSGNTGSIALHAASGFRFAGVLRATGWKFDRWLDTVLMQRDLGPGDRQAPDPGR
jgi:L-amino acid N-acyltransferase YncA